MKQVLPPVAQHNLRDDDGNHSVRRLMVDPLDVVDGSSSDGRSTHLGVDPLSNGGTMRRRSRA
jgi:hypothetical protein